MLKKLYNELETERHEYYRRGHKSAVLTTPAILPREGQSYDDLPQNFQSIGARGVNNLTSKLLLTLFPPTMPFMRLEVSEADMIALGAENEEQRTALVQSLQRIERQAMSRFDTGGWRPAMSEALRQLVVTGNVLLYAREGGRPAAYDIRRYVVERDAEGNLMKVILRAVVDPIALQPQVEGIISPEELDQMVVHDEVGGRETGVELFVGAMRQPDGKFTFCEEAGEIRIQTQEGLDEGQLPLMPLRFAPIYGASYGRGYVQDFDGALVVLESLSRALAEGSLALAKIIWLVKAGGMTRPDVLAKTPNGGIRAGDPEDVGAIQADKSSDLSVAYQYVQNLQVLLSNAFLLNSSVQRQGERVTAEEIRFVGQELEDALGAVYSGLADTVQFPVVRFFFNMMKKDGDIVDIPEEVEIVIATGLEAISRNHKGFKVLEYLQAIAMLPPDQIQAALNTRQIMEELATAFNLDPNKILYTQQQVQQNQQMQQQQALAERVGPQVVQAASQANQAQ